MESNITPNIVETKTSKAGKDYWSIQASDGKRYTLHEKDLLKNLQVGVCGKWEVAESGDWLNLKKYLGEGEETITAASAEKVAQTSSNGEDTSMYTSYAKDIFCAMSEEASDLGAEALMNVAIELVKQARTAFE